MGTHRKTSRREFLETAGTASMGLLAFSACESLDRLVLGKPRLDDTVIILGAGAAGLAAGIELKRRKVPFLIVDAANSPGGRLLSLSNFGADGEVLDLGGEWIAPWHVQTQRWVKDLRLELMDRSPKELDNVKLKELRSFGAALAKTPRVNSSNLSALDWIKGKTQESAFEDLVRQWCEFRFGAEPGEVQAFEIDREWRMPEAGPGKYTEARFRLRHGASTLVQGLFDRIGGVVPQENFLWGHRLFAVQRKERGVVLNFQMASGSRELITKKVICALPAGVLASIEGIDGIEKSLKSVRMGSQSKGGAYFENRFWEGRFDKGGGLAQLPSFMSWESRRRVKPQKGGALAFAVGGSGGRETGPGTIVKWREELVQSLTAEVPVPQVDHVQNWSQLSLFRGSHSVPSPGVERDSVFKNRSKDWLWAGEHVSRDFPGTIEGALETGREAGVLASGT